MPDLAETTGSSAEAFDPFVEAMISLEHLVEMWSIAYQ